VNDRRQAPRIRRRPGAGAPVALIGLAAGTGVTAGLVAAAISLAIDAATRAGLGAGLLLPLLPVLGGLAYGLVGYLVAPGMRGLGIPDLMLAMAAPGADAHQARAAVARVVGAVLCVGTGGPLGGEGPAAVAGSAIGHAAGRRARVPEPWPRLLGGCGVAAATAVIFGAPVAGVVFALELFLVGPVRRGPARTLPALLAAAGLLATASLAGTAVRRIVVGARPFADVGQAGEAGLAAAVLVGVLGGLAGAGFGKLVYLAEDAVDRVWRGPVWLRPAAGGVALGLLLLALPQLYGIGQPVIAQAAAGALPVALLLVLAAGKAVAASATLAVGGVGGVFAPMLFAGATLGSACAAMTGDQPGGCALAGMAAVVAGGARVPVTAVVLATELAGGLAPAALGALVVSTALATAAGRVVSPRTVYTRKLCRRGVRWPQ
jgi:CIC family chloride channel protein